MKRKILVVSIIVLILGLFSVGALAQENEPSLTLKAANLSFEDAVYLVYAVQAEGIDAKDIRMLFWSKPQENYTAITAESQAACFATNEEVDGVPCALFKNEDLTAKNMADDVYARAYAVVDGKEYYSEVFKYSILRYALNKLGITGTATQSAALKTMLENMLAYGASAQIYFNHNTDRLANQDYRRITVENGWLEDGFGYGLYRTGSTVTLTANETDGSLPFSHWKNAVDEIVSHDRVFTPTVTDENATYTACYGEPIRYSTGLSFESNGDGTCNVIGSGGCKDADVFIPPYSPTGDKVTGIKSLLEDRHETITIFEGVTTIYKTAFGECKGLKTITIPASVTTIEGNPFSSSESLETIIVSEKNKNYCALDGALYTKDRTMLITYPIGKAGTSFTIPSGVKIIGTEAFNLASKLRSVTFPDTVTRIEDYAFWCCSNLAEVNIAESSKLQYIGTGAFMYDYALTSFTVPATVTTIKAHAFVDCTSLSSVTFISTKGWYAGGTSVSSADLQDKSIAALYLRSTFRYKNWTK